MARRKRRNKKQQEEVLVDIVEARESAQDFIDRNQKTIFGVLTALVVVIGGYFGYDYFVKTKQQNSALELMSEAEYQFGRDSFALAITNPGLDSEGFEEIVNSYGAAPAGNASNYYAAVGYLNLGEYKAAISYLEDFDADGEVMPIMKNGILGDAHSELNELDKALSYYKKAASVKENEVLTPYYLMKVGMLQEKLGNFADAKEVYEQIKEKYPTSTDGRDIDKYIIRASAKG